MDLMTRRRALLARVQSGGRLPAEYQEVEYLESTGTQYINMFPIDPAPNPTSYLMIRLDMILSAKTSAEAGIFGGKQDAVNWGASPTLFLPSNSLQLTSWCGGQNTTFSSGFFLAVGTRYTIESTWDAIAGRVISVDGVSNTGNQSNDAMSRDDARNFCLFKDGAKRTQSYFSSLKVYGFILTVDNLILRNLIPCYRKQDSKPGMYDLVTGNFYVNQGTGEFLYGANVN